MSALPPVTNLVGRVLGGRYDVVRLLGRGGMGEVYEGVHRLLQKRVAIKVLNAELALDEQQRRRFLREARAATAIAHENVVAILDFGDDEPTFFVMDLLEGADLQTLLAREGGLSWPRARAMLLQIASALGAAHARGIVHRDVKPSNCFVTHLGSDREQVKVLDFGIAKLLEPSAETRRLTRTNAVIGTIVYAAPEQMLGQQVDARTDVYALGIVAYEMLTGRPPFVGTSEYQIFDQQVRRAPPPPSFLDPAVPPGVAALILRALEKDPSRRPQTMAEVAAELMRLDGTRSVGPPLPRPPTVAPTPPPGTRPPVVVAPARAIHGASDRARLGFRVALATGAVLVLATLGVVIGSQLGPSSPVVAASASPGSPPPPASPAVGGSVRAEPSKPTAAIPPVPPSPEAEARRLLDDARDAMGGAEKFASIDTWYLEGSLTVFGRTGTSRRWWRDGDFYEETKLPGIGSYRWGRSGDVAWSDAPGVGVARIPADEVEQRSWESNPMLLASWERYFSSAELVATRSVAGSTEHDVELVSASGAELTVTLDGRTRLPLRWTTGSPSAEPTVLELRDYREVDGMLLPFREVFPSTKTRSEQTMRVGRVELDGSVDATKFEMPKRSANKR